MSLWKNQASPLARSTKSLPVLGGLLLAIALVSSPTAQAGPFDGGLVQNPGFDVDQNLGLNGAPTDWSLTPGDNFYDGTQANTGAGFGPLSAPNSAQFGAQVGFVSPDILSQLLTTQVGDSYTFSFWINADPGSDMTVEWDSTKEFTLTDSPASFLNSGPSNGWTQVTATIPANLVTGSDTISFTGGTEGGPGNLDPNDDGGWVGIDNVRVIANGASASAPDGGATFGFLGGALAGLVALRRRFPALQPCLKPVR